MTKAKQASDANQKAILKEELEMAIFEIETNKIAENKEMKREDLAELIIIGATMESYGLPAEGEYKDYFFEVDKDYVVTVIGKVKGEKPIIEGEVITGGVVAKGGTVDIKVTASTAEGTIKSIESINGAILDNSKTNTETEKYYKVTENGTYYFKVKAQNGRSGVTTVVVNTIIEEPKISIKDITDESFKIEVTNNYAEGIVEEYKYYIGEELKNSGTTNTNYIVKSLIEDTTYTNIYVEAVINGEPLSSEVKIAKTKYTRVNAPKVAETGLTPVTISSNGTLIEVTDENTDWYHYSDTSISEKIGTSRWANAKTVDGSLWVWIPRYAYKITYYTTGEKTTISNEKTLYGDIDVVFLKDNTNKDFNGNDVTSTSYVDAKGKTGAYIIHPAFQDGSAKGKNNGYANGEWDNEITGFWMAKFKAGFEGEANKPETATDSNVKYSIIYTWNGSNFVDVSTIYYGERTANTTKIKYPVFKANRPSMNNIGIGDAYDLCLDIKNGSVYGLTNIDSHLTKNSEWGACAYLTNSKYGTNGEIVKSNNIVVNGENSISKVTGYGEVLNNIGDLTTLMTNGQEGSWTTLQGQLSSTTKNIYGIYDIGGGAWEWTAGYIATTTVGDRYDKHAKSMKGESSKYKSKYEGISGTDTINYNDNTNKVRIGEAIWETSINGTGNNSWNNKISNFLTINGPFTLRGTGIFGYDRNEGSTYINIGFRPVLIAE